MLVGWSRPFISPLVRTRAPPPGGFKLGRASGPKRHRYPAARPAIAAMAVGARLSHLPLHFNRYLPSRPLRGFDIRLFTGRMLVTPGPPKIRGPQTPGFSTPLGYAAEGTLLGARVQSSPAVPSQKHHQHPKDSPPYPSSGQGGAFEHGGQPTPYMQATCEGWVGYCWVSGLTSPPGYFLPDGVCS